MSSAPAGSAFNKLSFYAGNGQGSLKQVSSSYFGSTGNPGNTPTEFPYQYSLLAILQSIWYSVVAQGTGVQQPATTGSGNGSYEVA